MIGGPQNLYNLLSQFPSDSYTILTSFLTLQLSGAKRGNWLPGEYVFFDHRGPVTRETDVPSAKSGKGPGLRVAVAELAMTIAKHIPGVSLLLSPLDSLSRIIQMTAAGIRIVRQSPGNVILGISDNGPAMLSTFLVGLFTRTPYTLYLFDIYKGNNLTPFDRLIASVFEGAIFRRARLVILTNEGTEGFYKERYGTDIRTSVVHNSVFAEEYEKARTPYRPEPPYRIVFTGHVYWAQEQAVMNVIKAVDHLNDISVKLELYVPKLEEPLLGEVKKRPGLLLSSVPPSEIPEIQCAATLLILPLAWRSKSPEIIATATPGKFIDYLASGRPMLVHAPDYAYVAQYAKSHNLGLVVDKDDVNLLAQTIREFLDDPEQGRTYIENSLKIFYQNHDAKKNSRKLRRLLGWSDETPENGI